MKIGERYFNHAIGAWFRMTEYGPVREAPTRAMITRVPQGTASIVGERSGRDFKVGDTFTEADGRLVVTVE